MARTACTLVLDDFPPTIHRYLTELLVPELGRFGIPVDAAKVVAWDVGNRLWSMLARWNDAEFRKTVLLLALEEATFYKPRWAPLEIRAFVVLAVRDSLLEDLNATDASRHDLARFAQRVSDERVPGVTRRAVELFARESLATIAFPPLSAEDDVFGALAARYPRAWSALSTLAAMTRPEMTYEVAGKGAPIPVLATRAGRDRSVSVVVNGITADIDPELGAVLTEVAKRRRLFFSDSFKMVTRNPEKLFRILEFLLGHGVPLVTFNYYIGPDYLARRDSLLRPARGLRSRSAPEIEAKFGMTAGLTARHREAIEAGREAM